MDKSLLGQIAFQDRDPSLAFGDVSRRLLLWSHRRFPADALCSFSSRLGDHLARNLERRIHHCRRVSSRIALLLFTAALYPFLSLQLLLVFGSAQEPNMYCQCLKPGVPMPTHLKGKM